MSNRDGYVNAFDQILGQVTTEIDWGCFNECEKYKRRSELNAECIHYAKEGHSCDLEDEPICILYVKSKSFIVNDVKFSDCASSDCVSSKDGNSVEQSSKVAHRGKKNSDSLSHSSDKVVGNGVVEAVQSIDGSKKAITVRRTGDDSFLIQMVTLVPDELDVQSAEELGYEICMSGDFGDVWIVPKRTELDRKEITFRSLRMMLLFLQAFPGAKMTGLEKRK